MDADRPIGVIDSGVGGISVLRELVKQMPHESFVFYGDSANAPYGTRSAAEVCALVMQVVEHLMAYPIKALVVACNTATAAAIAPLRKKYPEMPIIGIEPAVKPAVLANPGGRIAVMATPTTLKNPKFLTLLNRYADQASILPVPCPGLMEYVEAGITEGAQLEDYLREKLDPVLPLDGIVLGCTHYPFIRNALVHVVGDSMPLYDGGPGTARETQRRLRQAGLFCPEPDKEGKVLFFNSKSGPEMILLSKRLFS